MSGALLEPLMRFGQQRGRARDEQPHPSAMRAGQTPVRRGAVCSNVGTPIITVERGSRSSTLWDIKLRQHQHPRAGKERGMRRDKQPMHVKQRQHMQQDVTPPCIAFRLESPEFVERGCVGCQIAMRQHRALAATSGARRIKERRQIVGCTLRRLTIVRKRRSYGQQRAVALLSQCHHVAAARRVRDRLDLRQSCRSAHDNGRLGVAQKIVELGALISGVQWYVDEPRPQRGQIQHQTLGRFLDLNCDSIPGFQAE